MFLKRAILNGFKSFADRTEFEFGAGITAVVGPNGCGKSNVVDAVRWVLGERSARNLRGEQMTDVIFAGSRTRKEAHFAEVQLVFDNASGILRSDDREVAVARVLYRNGVSEYRINGTKCRLKDIRDLLLDTGVGVDAYSVIEQGRVDSLLQANPLERREIFEEAAGVSRYKVRRVEAQRKLERTQANLLRLRDVLEELERRLRSVKLAAGKARNFQEYDARLRELRASFSLAEYHELEQRRGALAGQVEELSGALQGERATLAEQDAAVAEVAGRLQALDEQIQTGDAALREIETHCSTLAERSSHAERRLEELSALRERRTHQAAQADEQTQGLTERISAQEAEHAELSAAEQQHEGAIAELEARRKAAAQEAEAARRGLEQERVAAFDAARRGALLQNERTNLDQEARRLAAELERLRERVAQVEGEQARLGEKATSLAGQFAETEQRCGELAESIRSDEQQLSDLNAGATRLDEEVGQVKEERSGLQSRLTLLEDLERRLEGVAQGSRAILAWRSDAEGDGTVCGLVADVLQIDDRRVGVLQAVLADFEDHVVVRAAAQFFETLAQRPIDAPLRVVACDRIPTVHLASGYEATPGFVARASDWVSCAEPFRPLAEHLLGRVIIVDDRTVAAELAQTALAGYTFVALDGWVARADGRLSFGMSSVAEGLISRRAEIRHLHGQLDEAENRLVGLTRQRIELERAVSDAQLRRQGRLEALAAAQRQQAELRNAQVRVRDEAQRLEREHGVLDGDVRARSRSHEEVKQRQAALEQQCVDIGAAQQAHDARVRDLAGAVGSLEEEVAALARACTEALVARGRLTEKRAAAERTLAELRRQVAGLQQQAQTLLREAEEAATQLADCEAVLAQTRSELEQRQEARVTQEQAVTALRTQRQNERLELEQGSQAGRDLQRRIEAGDAELHGLQMTLRETDVRRETLVARVQDELGLDLVAQHVGYTPEEQDWDAVRAEIEELRAKIARLGNVNLDAITELEELAPRYDHMVAQRDDLTDAIDRLEKLITQLDDESRAAFVATFDQVRANFQEMFRKLFGGGKADVILEDPTQPLECGIEIIARPPGKEPRSITLLSGGEKTMTAVALLMAVFQSRPSPFCILDEVDAALDEANTDRFNKVVAEFLSHSQFVVITHSKRTMSSADVLYGVTMEEPGVSKRVSVRFDDRVHTPEVA